MNPYDVKVMFIESINFSISKSSLLDDVWTTVLSVNYFMNRIDNKQMTPANNILLWNFNSVKDFLHIILTHNKVTITIYVDFYWLALYIQLLSLFISLNEFGSNDFEIFAKSIM